MPFGQLLVEGLAIGACYGLFATAVVIIYKTSEVVNFAQGEMAMFASFVAFHILAVYQYPFWLAFVIAMLFSILLGVLIEFLFLRPAKHPSLLGMIVITLGAEMFLMGLASWKWGAEQKFFSLPLDPSVTYEPVKGMIVTNWAIAVFAVASTIMLLLYVFFKYTRLGVATRATLDPAFMMEPFLRAFAAAVLGGLMSIPGVIIGGGLMGLIENFFGYYWPHWKPIIAFIVIILVLCLRPSGLFAKHYVKKV